MSESGPVSMLRTKSPHDLVDWPDGVSGDLLDQRCHTEWCAARGSRWSAAGYGLCGDGQGDYAGLVHVNRLLAFLGQEPWADDPKEALCPT